MRLPESNPGLLLGRQLS
ncbi:hypothetical protein CR513_06427 [Mucuna pruriens]|uniref:Uncharacterized protein n=1 Tax=Mucuna pruriens TaxID=157652 RepID=A0A371I2R3_MUCPR|nr:hypothetical protein CR513_06427 [Mucuna pruriens]